MTRSSIAGRNPGYTLIELVMVTALAVILAAMAVGAYHAWTSRSAVESGQRLLSASLARAREYALARRVPTRCSAVLRPHARADALVIACRPGGTGTWWLVGSTNVLPEWVRFRTGFDTPGTGVLTTNVDFRTDGTCLDPEDPADDPDALGWLRFELEHQNRSDDLRHRRAVEVNRLTGLTREVDRLETEDLP